MRAVEELQRRLATLRDSRPFSNYQQTRESVLAMKDATEAAAATSSPSTYWRDELANLDYMFDASPLVIDRLRHHCYHVTGVWPYNYRAHKDRAHQQHAQKLAALMSVGSRELLVGESPALGGFGFEIDGTLVNVDTLKFFEVLIALDRGSVLGEFRERTDRSCVWEIGAGWGGFAYQFKTLFPDTTYVIVDLPELFLYSATYLMTLFPDARVSFVDGKAGEVPWSDADFVFIPNDALHAVRPSRVDLVLNMVSFQEMTTAQVMAYVEHAHALGAPYFYSLNRDRSVYNPELTSVTQILETRYSPHVVEVLPVSYAQLSSLSEKKPKLAARMKGSDDDRDSDYRHIVGWRKLQP